MLNKIMYKGDMFIPNLNGKTLKDANYVDAIGIIPVYGNVPSLDFYFHGTTMPAGSYHLYLLPDNYRDDGKYGFTMFDLMSYIQNGGVFNSLLNHLYQWFNSLFRKWVRA